ncbi:site-specific integrase [Clostridium perfringens]|nr:site-specific integrase [Clostridium perfringens]
MARKTNRVLAASQEELVNIKQENKELMDDYLNYCETIGKRPSTITVYKSNLEIFFCWFYKFAKNKDFCELKKRDIMNFQNYMVKNKLSPSRIRNIRSTISNLSDFCCDILDEEEKWENFKNIVNKIKAPTLCKVREKTVLEEDECKKLLDYLVSTKQYQKACVFALAWSSGRRKSELLRIKRHHIQDENLVYGLYKTPEKIESKGKGVNGKEIHMYILKSKFKPYFDLWMEERKRLDVPDEIDDIFVKKTKKDGWIPMKKSTLDSWAIKFTEFFKKDFYFHCMRHQFTTELVRAGVPTNIIKEIICWENSDMVDLYTDLDVDDRLGDFFKEDGTIKKQEKKTLADI